MRCVVDPYFLDGQATEAGLFERLSGWLITREHSRCDITHMNSI